jgi:hypothetical protein
MESLDAFVIENRGLGCFPSSFPSSSYSSTASSSSASSASSSTPSSASDSSASKRDADGYDVEVKGHPSCSSLATTESSILEKALAAIAEDYDDDEEEGEIEQLLCNYQENKNSHNLSDALPPADECGSGKSLDDIWNISDFEDFLLLDFSCLEDETDVLKSSLSETISLPSDLEIDTMSSTLFAFNASCSSPSCR